MKLMITLCALLLTTSAFATSSRSHQVEILPIVEINGKPTHYTGRLEIDYVNRQMNLQIFNDPCGSMAPQTGTFHCMAMASLVTSMQVPLQKTETSCGSSMYSGLVDQAMVDGARYTIEVSDNSSRICDDIRRLVEVRATVYSPQTNETTEYQLAK